MPNMNKGYGWFGAAVQTAKGTAAAAPTVNFYASASSDGIAMEKSTEDIRLTMGRRSNVAGSYVDSVDNTAKVTTLGFADPLALMFYAALGADEPEAATGTTGYVHDITCGEEMPYLTFFQQAGASSAAVQTLKDAKVNNLKLTAEGIAPVSMEYELIGTEGRWTASTTWPGSTPADASACWYTVADATVLFSLSDDEPGAVPAYVQLESFEMEVDNAVEAKTTLGKADPADVKEGSATVTATLSGTSSDTVLYREAVTGSQSGTTIASYIVTGSLQVTFKHTVNEDWTLVLKLPSVPWKVDVMGVDPDGGPFDLTISTDGAVDAGSGVCEVIVNAGLESY